MSVTFTSRPNLTTADNAADFLAIDDTSTGVSKRISPDNLRDSMLTGSALTTVDDTTLTASRAVVSNTSGQIAVSDVTATELGYVDGVTSAIQTQLNAKPLKNLLHNGNFDVWSKGTSFTAATTPANNDDTYLLPHWNLVSDGNDILDLSQQTGSPPDGSRYYLRGDMTAATGSALWGIVQFLEAKEAIALRGKTVSLSFQAKANSDENSSLNAAILAWDGTADTLTSDVVSAWAATPTWAANWTQEGIMGSTAMTTGFVKYSLDGVVLDTSGLNNIAIVIWSTSTTDKIYDITQAKLEINTASSSWVSKAAHEETGACQRVHLRLPGDASANGPNINAYGAAGSDTPKQWFSFPTTMRTNPTGTVAGTWALTNCTGPTLDDINSQGASMVATATGAGMCIIAPNGVDDWLDFDAGL